MGAGTGCRTTSDGHFAASGASAYEPVLRRGPAAHYWAQDFLEAWIIVALPRMANYTLFAEIWRGMVDYTFSLSAWVARRPGIWFHAESLSVDLMGLRKEAVKVLGRKEYTDLVKAMASTFKGWGDQWLKCGSVAAWFANFLSTESRTSVAATGYPATERGCGFLQRKRLGKDGLALSLTSALAAGWKHVSGESQQMYLCDEHSSAS